MVGNIETCDDRWGEEYRFMDDKYAANCMYVFQKDLGPNLGWEQRCLKYKAQDVPYWEFTICAETLLNGGYINYPSVNMISNVGVSENTTHVPESFQSFLKRCRDIFMSKLMDWIFRLSILSISLWIYLITMFVCLLMLVQRKNRFGFF